LKPTGNTTQGYGELVLYLLEGWQDER